MFVYNIYANLIIYISTTAVLPRAQGGIQKIKIIQSQQQFKVQ